MGCLDFIAYQSVKVVVVRDYRLALLYYLSLIGIAAYIIWNSVTTGSYLDKAPPVAGSVRATVQFDSRFKVPKPSYCHDSDPNPKNFQYGCLYWSENQIVYPYQGELNTIFITTRVSISDVPTVSGCNFMEANSTGCQVPAPGPKRTYYVANVEALSFRVDHSVRVQASFSFGQTQLFSMAPQNMNGTMTQQCGKNQYDVITFNGAYRSNELATNGTRLDTFLLGDLLNSAQGQKDDGSCPDTTIPYDFNTVSTADGAKPGEPVRSAGGIISTPIFYTNKAQPFSLNGEIASLDYKYLPSFIKGSEFKVVETVTNQDGSLTYVDRHGFRVVFAQTGSIGIFNMINALLNVVAGFALFSVAAVIVDSIMLYILPKRKEYQSAKFQETAVLHPTNENNQALPPLHFSYK
ncbi:cytochrome c oxidase subunit 1 [Boothiomyces macroporosus]|uniref:Cytochrome c oxidase subunit 1 n=1 Tax=Boothiomyces macroporosus TaxID=261099 RepID=A0AAD5UEE6_9FUNG|nr:cytochrome c oxidase subunit 1 [Boothiomyces macroporosus]